MKRFNRVLDLTSTNDASDTSAQRQNYDRAFWAWRRIANLGNPLLTQSKMSIECPSLGVGPLQESPKQKWLLPEDSIQECLSQECQVESPLQASPLQECPRQKGTGSSDAMFAQAGGCTKCTYYYSNRRQVHPNLLIFSH